MMLMMTRPFTVGMAALALAAGLGSSAHAAVAWDETINGDLSGANGSPTFIALASGANDVLGRTGSVSGTTDRDYFTVTVPGGMVLSAIKLLGNTALVSATDKAFIGISAGASSPAPGFTTAGLIGYVHFLNADIGKDLLPTMGSLVPPGFTPPLGAGNYSFWVQDTTPGTASYGFSLMITSVPEPATAASLLAGLLSLGWLARQRQRG